jgi:hypothetical protein
VQGIKMQAHKGDESIRQDSLINDRLKTIETLKESLKCKHNITDEIELLRNLSMEIAELRELRGKGFSGSYS